MSRSRLGTPAQTAKYSFSTVRFSNCAGQLHVHLIGLGHDHHAAGVAIQPMHDARPRRSAGRAELVEMKLQRRGQRAGPMSLGRMHDHARRLVDDRQIASSS